jgi:type II secretory pathway pseudopilin PulG
MKGFTFIELLLVLGLITALITIFVYFINPVEILKKHRDIQRINDLKALEIAISTYLSANPNADPDGIFEGTGKGEINQSIYVSIPYDKEVITNATITDGMGNVWNIIQNSSSSNMRNIDGNGWIPINFTEMKYPVISYLPVDPINSYSLGYFYTYVFERKTKTFELNAKLEYKLFNKGEAQDIVSRDGGSDNEIYEAGSNKCIIIGNRLYGNISTTTCKEIGGYGGSQIDYGRCNNIIKIETGDWTVYNSTTNQPIATETISLHDNDISTGKYLTPDYYFTHDFGNKYYIEKLRAFIDYGAIGGAQIEYWDLNNSTWTNSGVIVNRGNWTVATLTNYTTKWRITGSNATVYEMEAYGCPIYWSRYFDGNSIAYDIKKSKEKDGYYYIVAGTKNNDFWLAKLTPDGNIKFATSFGGSYTDIINSIEVDDEDNDGYIDYYVLGGYTNSYGTNAPTSTNGYLIKMTTSSNILASQAYGATFNDDIREVKKSLDGYYFSIGSTLVITPSTTTNLWFLKIATSNLSLLSEVKLGGSNETIGNSLVLFDTSTALLSGKQFTNSYFANFDLINNTTTYTEIYATATSSEEIVRIIKDKLVSNAILALVKIWDDSKQIYYFQIRRIYIYDGRSELITTYSNYSLNEIPTDFLQNDDGSIIVVGYSRYGNLYPNLTIYKFDPYGRFVYRKEYDRGIAYSVEKAFDLGYVVVGYSYKTNSAWVIHLDENGDCPNCFAEKRSIFEIFANIFKFISQLLKFPPLY